jgi:hypothetical protein
MRSGLLSLELHSLLCQQISALIKDSEYGSPGWHVCLKVRHAYRVVRESNRNLEHTLRVE